MSLDPRNMSYARAPRTPEQGPLGQDEFSFARQPYTEVIDVTGDGEDDDDGSVYTLNGTESGTLYDLPTHISSHTGTLAVPGSPQTLPPSPVGTPFTERPQHPLRALTATNLVLNQQNGTDESLMGTSPVVPSMLRQTMALNELDIDDSGPGSGSDDDISDDGVPSIIPQASKDWQDRGAAVGIQKIRNDDGEEDEIIIRRSVKDFKFGKTLGNGSYSTVILATDKNTGRQFAVKVLDKRHIIREKKVKYVNIEKNTLSRLGKRDGIVHMFFTFQDESSLYFVLDYAPNGELLALIKEHGSLNEETTKYYGAQLLDAVKYMHDNGVIHRDLKPENILMDSNMKLQITDFGTAKLMEKDPTTGAYPQDTRSKSFVGTAEYVSPELLNEKAVGKPCDIWAFGCIIYQMIAGKPPFKATNEYLTFQKIVKLQYAFTAGFPMVIRDLIKKILVLHPKDRLTIKGIQSHLFFNGIDFKNPKESIWDVPPPQAGPYKISAKSMLPVPELQSQGSRTRITIPRRSVSTPSTPIQGDNKSSDSISSTPPSAAQSRESQQVLMRAKANIAARKQKESNRLASGAAGAAALALSRQPNDIIKAHNDRREVQKSESESAIKTTTTTTSTTTDRHPTPAAIITTLRKKPTTHSSPVTATVVPPMTKLDLEFVEFLKDSEERVLHKGDINVYLTTVEAIEKKHKRRLVDAPLGGNKTGSSSSSLLSQVANGSYRGLRNMEKHGEEAEKSIITNHNIHDGHATDDLRESAKNRFKKFFSGGSGEEDKKNRLLIVTSNGRALIFNKLDADGEEAEEDEEQDFKLELRTEISLAHPVIKIKELLPTSTSTDTPSLFVIESYNTAFVFESTQTDVSSWTQALHRARMSLQEKQLQKKLQDDPSGNAGTVLGSDAAKSAATIVTSPTLKPSEFPPATKTRTASSSSTTGSSSTKSQGHSHMLKDMVSRRSTRAAPKEVPDQGRLYHGLPMSLLTQSNKPQNPMVAAASAAIVSNNSKPARKPPAPSPPSGSMSGTQSSTQKHITGMNSRLLARSVRSSKSKK